MRIDPVHHNISFWALHWPWWRTKMRTVYGLLPARVRHVLRPAVDCVILSGSCPIERPCDRESAEPAPPVRAPEDDRSPIDRQWPSDLPIPPEPRVETIVREQVRPRESGDYFDFLI